MKVLLVSYYPLPYPGGIWTFVSNLKKRLESLGHTVDVLSHTPEATKYRIIGRKPEISISQLAPNINKKITKMFPSLNSNYWIYHTELYRYSLELSSVYYGLEQYDLIHAQDVIAASAMSRVKPKHIPLVTSAHGYLTREVFYVLKTLQSHKTDQQLQESFEYQYHNKLEYEGYHASDFIHTQSNWMLNNIINYFSVSPKKIVTFPYGMDIEEFLKRSNGETFITPPKTKKVILFMGRLVYLKGVHHLIDALAILKHYRNDWECWILGDGGKDSLKMELEAQCQKLNLTNEIKFLGVTNNVPHVLKQADIFVLPSLQDTQPHSVMEAQISGVPVIVSNAAGLPEMVKGGKRGLVAPVGNILELSEQIKHLLANDSNRKQLGIETKIWAQKYWSLDKMVNNFLSLYKLAIH